MESGIVERNENGALAPIRPKAISLFSGAGGIDYGLEAAGFETAVAVECDHDCCETLRSNRHWPVIEQDASVVPTNAMLERGRLKKGEADLLVASLRQQRFFNAGDPSRGASANGDESRTQALAAVMRVLEEAMPRAFLVTSAEGFAFSEKDEGLRAFVTCIDGINRRTGSNYKPVTRVLSIAEYGVPQLRDHEVLIAGRDGTDFVFPLPTHRCPDEAPADLFERSLPTYRTAWDALADVHPDRSEHLELRGRWAQLLPTIPEGRNYLHHTERGEGLPLFGWRRRPWNFLLKLAKNRPSWTVQAQPGPAIGPFHWENRLLGLRELCRLQTVPDSVTLCGDRPAQQQQVGNAFPSLLAEVLARAIRSQILSQAGLREPLRLLLPARSPMPPPEPVVPVPRRVRELVSDRGSRTAKMRVIQGELQA